MGGFNDAGDCLWFIAQHEVEQGFASGGVRAVVVDKLGHGNMVGPGFRVGPAEDAEIGLTS